MKIAFPLIAVVFSALASLVGAQEIEGAIRTLTSKKGASIEAVLLDKNETMVTVKMKNGKSATFPIADWIDKHQAIIRSWNKDNFLRELNGVINYREERVFLRQG